MVGTNQYLRYDGLSRNLTVVNKMRVPSGGGNLELMLQCTILNSGGSRTVRQSPGSWTRSVILLFSIIQISIRVIIHLIDINDHAPAFSQNQYEASIKEVSEIF